MKFAHLMQIAATLLILMSSNLSADTKEVSSLMSSYIGALVDEDYEGASEFWHPEYIETSRRLGISYRDVPYKYDCMSPLLRNIELIRNNEASWNTIPTLLDPNHFKVILKIHMPDGEISYDYFFQSDSTGTFLIPRFWLHLNNLNVVKTRYFDVFYRNPSQINDFALFELDRFIEETATAMGAPKELLETLERRRMEYYLAESDTEVSELLGFPTRGIYFVPCDIIMSRYMPDYHEVALFALSYTQENLGLHAEPFIRRGLAASYGGRFGQSREVMSQIASFTLDNELYTIEDVLTVESFHGKIGSIDFSYPLSVGLVESIADKYNITTALKLLSELSGSIDELSGWTSDDVKSTITSATGASWAEIESHAREQIAADRFPNLKPGALSDSGDNMFESGTNNYVAKITLHDGWYHVTLKPYYPDLRIEGTILASGSIGVNFEKFKSFLFQEQFSEIPYISELYSIRYSPDEIGVYDYLTNRLIAKYVTSFDPDSQLVTDGQISFRFKQDLLRSHMHSYKCRIMETASTR